jgi:hypothetical protein
MDLCANSRAYLTDGLRSVALGTLDLADVIIASIQSIVGMTCAIVVALS